MREATLPPAALPALRATGRAVLPVAVGAVALLLLVLVLYPSVVLVLNAVTADGRVTLQLLARVAADSGAHRALVNSLVVSGSATAGGTVLGTVFAWLVTRTDLPGRGRWDTALLLPYMIPPFIGAIAWVYLLGPVGYLNQAWRALTGAQEPLLVIYGPAGVVAVLTLYGYPIAYATMRGVLERMHPALEEAARIAGAGPARVLREVTLPLMLPGVLAAAVLLFMSSLANFGIPAVIGFPARYVVLPTKIYDTILNFDLPHNLQVAAALSLWLVAIAAVLLWSQRRLLRRATFAVVTGQAGAPTRLTLGRWRWPAVMGLGAFVLVSVLLPLAAILLTALTRAYGLAPAPEHLTLGHLRTALLGIPKVQRALVNSVGLAAGSATLVVALGLVLGYLVERVRVRGAPLLELLVTIPYAVPGTVVALAMILAWLRPVPLVGLHLYNTIWILLVAYVARFLVFGFRTVMAGLAQVHPSLEEAARISGATAREAFQEVVLPILRPSLAAGWVLVFIPAVAELTLSVLLYSAGHETLGVVVFGLHEEGKIALSAAVAALVTLLLVALHLGVRAVAVREVLP
ncbi:MAG: iron ABC transporter permease [Armatimonadota bacterium]|nr:iron ABC transporter permease [Armatimonadota bacterium]MDR7449024.1 iron ABC transporter permease [Armatimonadota bacterium]MDR7459468.1 iron ABC transporter permease [Armatimonadota bacterium]MDR7480167.1 iron ABC transporter permease [Armatimonadota bacterium]MDR7488557.1 iron ABC transporter permease [Armatimonadota bacterium]